MTPYPAWTGRRVRRPVVTVSALLLGLAVLACSPGDGPPEGETRAPGDAAAADPGAAAQEAPACQWTASGEELTARPSPPDSAMVQLNGGTVKLCYSAPSARGREVMGGLVPYGRPWRMGANEPTTLYLPVAAEVGDVRTDAGTYSLYAIPGEAEWTIVVNADTDRWGIPINEGVRARDVGSFTVQPERAAQPVERMSIELEPVEAGAARAVLEWENTRVGFPIRRAGG